MSFIKVHTSVSNTFCAGERATAYDRMSAKVGDTHDNEQEALQSTPKVLSWLANKSVSKSPSYNFTTSNTAESSSSSFVAVRSKVSRIGAIAYCVIVSSAVGTAHSGGGWVQSPFGQLFFFFFFLVKKVVPRQRCLCKRGFGSLSFLDPL